MGISGSTSADDTAQRWAALLGSQPDESGVPSQTEPLYNFYDADSNSQLIIEECRGIGLAYLTGWLAVLESRLDESRRLHGQIPDGGTRAGLARAVWAGNARYRLGERIQKAEPIVAERRKRLAEVKERTIRERADSACDVLCGNESWSSAEDELDLAVRRRAGAYFDGPRQIFKRLDPSGNMKVTRKEFKEFVRAHMPGGAEYNSVWASSGFISPF